MANWLTEFEYGRRMSPDHMIESEYNVDSYAFVDEADISDIERAIAQDGSFEPLPYVGDVSVASKLTPRADVPHMRRVSREIFDPAPLSMAYRGVGNLRRGV